KGERETLSLKFCDGELQHRAEEADFRIANRELRRVHSHRQATGAGSQIITEQTALPSFIELAIRIEGERAGGNDQPFAKGGSKLINSCHRAPRNVWAWRDCVRPASPNARSTAAWRLMKRLDGPALHKRWP